MTIILSILLLFHINGFLLSMAILGMCFLCKIIMCKRTWTEFFAQLGWVGTWMVVVLSMAAFTFIAYFFNRAVLEYVDFAYALKASLLIPTALDVILLTQVKRGKDWLIHGEVSEAQDTIYK